MKKIVFYALCLCGMMGVFSSCNEPVQEEGIKTLRIDTESDAVELALDDYADYSLIPLETLDSVLIGRVSEIRVHGDVLAVGTSENTIVFFDLNGNYLSTVSHYGDGPEDYNYISGFQLAKTGEVMVFNQHDVTKVYSIDNQFVRSLNCKGYDCTVLGSDFYTYTALNAKKGRITVYNVETGDSICAFSSVDPYPTVDLAVPFKPLSDTESYYIPAFSDTIFTVKDRTQTPKFVLDFGSAQVKPEMLSLETGIMDLFPKLMEGHEVVSVEMFNKGTQYCWMQTLQFDGQVEDGAMNIMPLSKWFCIQPDGQSVHFDKLVLKKYHDFTFEPSRLICADGEHFGCYVESGTLMEYAESLDAEDRKAFMEQLNLKNDDQNPYILLVKSK